MPKTLEERAAALSALGQFLLDKTDGALHAGDCILMYEDEKMDDANMAQLRHDLESVRDGAVFALEAIREL